MKTFYLVKAINPMTDCFKQEYNIYECLTSKAKAQAEKKRMQGLGFKKVCIKRNVNFCLYLPTKG